MRYFLLGMIGACLSGCALPIPIQIASWAASGISYIATGKSMSDHAFSAVAEQDCAIHRIVLGQSMCHEYIIDADGTAVAVGPSAPAANLPADPPARLRDSLIALAQQQDDAGLLPASGPTSQPAGPAKAEKTEQIDKALVALADTLNTIGPVPVPDLSQKAAAEGRHYVIIGRYRNLSEAEGLRQRHASLHTAVRMVLEQGDLLFQVTAGPFTRPDAIEIGGSIAEKDAEPLVAQLCDDLVTPAPCGGAGSPADVQVTTAAGRY
jgi:hypothetical protein